MSEDPESTIVLLRRWHAGERAALDRLLEIHLPWIRERVEVRLGPLLRARGASEDYVQDAMLEVLRYSPRFLIEDRAQFRALMARIVENMLGDQNDWFRRKRRDLHRERPLPDDSVLMLDRPRDSVTRPSEHAIRGEQQAWTRLALELLEPDDRKLILLRQWEERPFAEIGREMGITEDAARMRFQRALGRIARKVEELARGRLAD